MADASQQPPSLKHELRTPLNHIIGFCEMLIEEAEDEPASPRHTTVPDLQKIHAAAQRLLDLVMANFGSTRFTVDASERLNPDGAVRLLHRDTLARNNNHLTGKILVADDDDANREMLARRLERLGHTVTTAINGREVVDMVRTGTYDLLLLDIIMPVMNGYQVLEHLQINPPPKSLPVIALSASDNTENIAHCIEIGAEDYLPKPFAPALLQARIDSSLEKKRLRDREVEYLETIQREKERSDDLLHVILHVILPANIAAELKETGNVRPRRIDNVAVLFTDIVGFTAYCEKRAPETIHLDLQQLVKELEVLTAANGMEKIKTNPLSPHLRSLQRRPQSPHAKSKFLAITRSASKLWPTAMPTR